MLAELLISAALGQTPEQREQFRTMREAAEAARLARRLADPKDPRPILRYDGRFWYISTADDLSKTKRQAEATRDRRAQARKRRRNREHYARVYMAHRLSRMWRGIVSRHYAIETNNRANLHGMATTPP